MKHILLPSSYAGLCEYMYSYLLLRIFFYPGSTPFINGKGPPHTHQLLLRHWIIHSCDTYIAMASYWTAICAKSLLASIKIAWWSLQNCNRWAIDTNIYLGCNTIALSISASVYYCKSLYLYLAKPELAVQSKTQSDRILIKYETYPWKHLAYIE